MGNGLVFYFEKLTRTINFARVYHHLVVHLTLLLKENRCRFGLNGEGVSQRMDNCKWTSIDTWE